MRDVHVGVRFDDVEALQRACRAYSSFLVEDERAVADLSVVLRPPAGAAGSRARPSFRHGGCDLVRSASPDRLLRALDTFLVTGTGVPSGLVKLDGFSAITADRAASLVPAALLDRSSAVERRIVRAGAQMADAPSVLFDPRGRQVVVVEGLAGDDALEIDAADSLAAPGRYDLARIHWSAGDVASDERRALAVLRLLNRCTPSPSVGAEDVMAVMTAIAGRSSATVVGDRGTADLDAVLAELRR